MTSTKLRAIRERRGIAASDPAALTGVARQTIYAIEAGSFVPNTTVALQLARALDARAEEIFQLDGEPNLGPQMMQAELLDVSVSATEGMPVRLCRVGARLIAAAVQVAAASIPDANGVIGSRASAASVVARLLLPEKTLEQTILIAGCDPAISILSRFLMKTEGVEGAAIECSSRRALALLKEGKVHLAGMHLRDAVSGELISQSSVRLFRMAGFM